MIFLLVGGRMLCLWTSICLVVSRFYTSLVQYCPFKYSFYFQSRFPFLPRQSSSYLLANDAFFNLLCSPKLRPLVDYLLSLARVLEKKQISSNGEIQTSKFARRLKKMLVELNQYDYARDISRTFNIKEALWSLIFLVPLSSKKHNRGLL